MQIGPFRRWVGSADRVWVNAAFRGSIGLGRLSAARTVHLAGDDGSVSVEELREVGVPVVLRSYRPEDERPDSTAGERWRLYSPLARDMVRTAADLTGPSARWGVRFVDSNNSPMMDKVSMSRHEVYLDVEDGGRRHPFLVSVELTRRGMFDHCVSVDSRPGGAAHRAPVDVARVEAAVAGLLEGRRHRSVVAWTTAERAPVMPSTAAGCDVDWRVDHRAVDEVTVADRSGKRLVGVAHVPGAAVPDGAVGCYGQLRRDGLWVADAAELAVRLAG